MKSTRHMHACYLWNCVLPPTEPVAGRAGHAFHQLSYLKGSRERNLRLQSDVLRDKHITSGRQPLSEFKCRPKDRYTEISQVSQPQIQCVSAKSLQSCLTLFDSIDYGPPSSSVHGILQARSLERVAMPSSRGSAQPRDQTCISYVSCIGRQGFVFF